MNGSLMKAIVTTGNGGYEKLVYQVVAIPKISQGDVPIKVLAAGVNNTEINTRLGCYFLSITELTNETVDEETIIHSDDGVWNTKTPYPFIQGTDCCGKVVSAAEDISGDLLGKRSIPCCL